MTDQTLELDIDFYAKEVTPGVANLYKILNRLEEEGVMALHDKDNVRMGTYTRQTVLAGKSYREFSTYVTAVQLYISLRFKVDFGRDQINFELWRRQEVADME